MTYCMMGDIYFIVQRDAREDIWERELANSPFSVFIPFILSNNLEILGFHAFLIYFLNLLTEAFCADYLGLFSYRK